MVIPQHHVGCGAGLFIPEVEISLNMSEIKKQTLLQTLLIIALLVFLGILGLRAWSGSLKDDQVSSLKMGLEAGEEKRKEMRNFENGYRDEDDEDVLGASDEVPTPAFYTRDDYIKTYRPNPLQNILDFLKRFLRKR